MKKYAWSMLTAALLGLSLAGASLVSAQPPATGPAGLPLTLTTHNFSSLGS